MTLASTGTRLLAPLVAAMASLVCVQAACSLKNLDYLQNGDRRDGAIESDQGMDMSTPDTVGPNGLLLDASDEDGAILDLAIIDAPPILDSSRLDSLIRDSLVLDTHGEIVINQATDTSSRDTTGSDSALLDATVADQRVSDAPVLDASPNLDSSSPKTQDARLGADTASGGGTGTLDAGTAQGGSGGHSSSGGGTSSSGGTSSTGGAPSSTGTSAAAGTGGSAGGQVATGGQGGGGSSGSTATPACSGVLYAGICWYLGSQGSSCQEACASHGQPAPDAASHVGTATQGGSLAECAHIFGLLGISGTPSDGTRSDGRGLGCHQWASGSLWRLTTPDFSATANQGSARLVCGCTQ
jgi:hypothetical protein